ncbi:hypothetical protein M9H77_29960 [Catharanthus roseus]|uniref:Uncharacterized protein n=1 Tax=Catharanthus roseus TaxID=4058 RepID=A0ACB9ZY44_CATRO|nr:hypothetical protein M9H77_29960 [Catharanthus roseus]
MITHVERRSMLVMWRTGISADSILVMALFCLWYRDITRVYIGNSVRHDTRTIGYHPTMISMLQEIDDMATGVLEGPPSSPTQYVSFPKKVQTIIRRCMPSRSYPREPVPEHGARGVKKGARRFPGGGTCRG